MTQTDILRNIRIDALTPMQQAMGEAYARYKNIVLLSPTGSGKTLAFLLPLVQHLKDDVAHTAPQALILVPSRELALQIEQVFRQMGTPFRAVSCYGGRPTMDEHRTLRGIQPHVIVGTPGRILDHLKKQNFLVSHLHTLVIDEFDKCLEFGFHDEMSEVINHLSALKKRILLSATDAEEIPQFTGVGQESEKLNFLSEESPVSNRLNLYRVLSPQKDKLETLYRLLCTVVALSSKLHAAPSSSPADCPSSLTLVFVNYRESVDRIATYLKSKKFPCDIFHGGMEQQERERALYKFRNGSCPVLISTDLAARGLDIPHIDNVVHYHLPLNEEAFTHRNGRTARWEATGSSYMLLHAEERIPDYLPADTPVFDLPEQTPRPPRSQWATLYIGKGKKEKLSRMDIVGFLYKKGNLAREDVGTVDVRDHYAFAAIRRDKVKQLLTLIRGEKIKGIKTIIEEAR